MILLNFRAFSNYNKSKSDLKKPQISKEVKTIDYSEKVLANVNQIEKLNVKYDVNDLVYNNGSISFNIKNDLIYDDKIIKEISNIVNIEELKPNGEVISFKGKLK